jgi:hypothetical protein
VQQHRQYQQRQQQQQQELQQWSLPRLHSLFLWLCRWCRSLLDSSSSSSSQDLQKRVLLLLLEDHKPAAALLISRRHTRCSGHQPVGLVQGLRRSMLLLPSLQMLMPQLVLLHLMWQHYARSCSSCKQS